MKRRVLIAEAEYAALRKLHDECVCMRDAGRGTAHPLRDWNRMSPGVRLAVVELDALDALYRSDPRGRT